MEVLVFFREDNQPIVLNDVLEEERLLADDVVMHSDGGSKVRAALKPIYGAARVAWGLLGLMRKVPPGATSHLALVNGQLGILTYLDGIPYAVLAFFLANDRIKEIALIVNPDTLHGIPGLA